MEEGIGIRQAMFDAPQGRPLVVKVPNDALPATWREDIAKGKEEGATIDNMDPSCPFLVLEKFDWDKACEWLELRYSWVAKSIPNDIIIPDPTPKMVRDAFFDISPRLTIALRKDNVRGFFDLFGLSPSALAYKFTITSDTLTYIVRHNALRCAKVVLEGKSPELGSMHANPNCMNRYGNFPLHEAAVRFSVPMIKLLFRHGASANVRTAADAGSQGSLPLHVAVEKICLHRGLVDNISPMQYREDYIYKLIHLLCLPEMKVSLDTVRLLARKTENLVDELWNYMKNGKLAQTAVLFLAAQKHIRKGETNGFHIITQRILDSVMCDKGDTGEAQKQLEERKALLNCKYLLFNIILRAGEVIDDYIQAHSEVLHVEVLAHVSSILKESGFCPKEEYIDTINLSAYKYRFLYRDVFQKGHIDATKAVEQTSSLNAAEKKAVRKKALRGWDRTYKSEGLLLYRRPRSTLGGLILPNAAADDKSLPDGGQFRNYWSNSISNESLIPNHNIGFLGRIQQLIGTHQSRRYSTAAFKIIPKVLKHA